MMPSYYSRLILSLPVNDVATLTAVRLYGVVMAAVTVLMWHTAYSTDKDVLKCSVTVAIICCGGHIVGEHRP